MEAILIMAYLVVAFCGGVVWPYAKTGELDEEVYGIERVIAGILWPIVLPIAGIRWLFEFLFTEW